MRHLDLFSGIGGFALGLEMAGGYETVGFVEIDEFCQQVLKKHWPDVPIHSDIKELKGDEFGAIDIITAGFPCQPVSFAGKRLAQKDERWLWPATARAIRLFRPGIVVLENVPGLVTAGLGDVLGDLSLLGYDAEWFIVSAASVGAPHLRKRIFVMAHSDSRQSKSADESESRNSTHLKFSPDSSGESGPVAYSQGNLRRTPWNERQVAPDGGRANLADPDGSGYVHGEPQEQPAETGKPAQRRPGRRCQAMADPESIGRQPRRARNASQKPGGREPDRGHIGADMANAKGERREYGNDGELQRSTAGEVNPPTSAGRYCRRLESGWWSTEPDVGRVANGIPSRVDRLKSLGNAVVPQVIEVIGLAIRQVSNNG